MKRERCTYDDVHMHLATCGTVGNSSYRSVVDLKSISTTAALRVASDSERQLAICRASQRCATIAAI